MNLEEQESKPLLDIADNKQPAVIIPVMEESFQVDKQVVETAKIHISKKVISEDAQVNIPLTDETYEITRIPVSQVVNIPPAVRHEGDTMIIPVVKEVLVVEKRYEITEELHITKRTTERNETRNIMLLKEEVEIQRTPVINDEREA